MCVALGNYHNCGDGEEIASEYVALRDVEGMVGMMVGVAMGGWERDGGERMRGKLEENLEKYRRFFEGEEEVGEESWAREDSRAATT